MTVNDGDHLKITFDVLLDDGSHAQNVYWLEAVLLAPFSDAVVLAAVETWIEGIYGNLSANLLASMTQGICTLQEVTFNVGESAWLVTKLLGYFTPTITFNNLSEGLPNQSSAFATFNTTRPKSHGRKFLPPFGEDQQADTYLISGALTAMANYAADVLDDVDLGGLSVLAAGICRSGVDSFLPFTVAVVTNILGSQRRRRPGVGI